MCAIEAVRAKVEGVSASRKGEEVAAVVEVAAMGVVVVAMVVASAAASAAAWRTAQRERSRHGWQRRG